MIGGIGAYPKGFAKNALSERRDPNIHNVEEAFNLIHYQQIVVEKENWPMFEHFYGRTC